MRGFLVCFALAAGCTCASGVERPRDAGGPDGAMDAGHVDASTPFDAFVPPDARPDAPADAPLDAPTDAGPPDAGPIDSGIDAGDAGCVVGSTRTCTLMCMGGSTAEGVERCMGGGAWSPCERATEICGNALDDDGDGAIDEDCRVEGACIWVRPQCQGVMTLNEWCMTAGGRHLVAGRRCAVAGGGVVPLDVAYGAYPLCCCDIASMCVPECIGPACATCVVWDEIQCCP